MREAVSPTGLLTFDEFLQIEAASDVRHEFVGGVRHARAEAARRHNLIAGNVMFALTSAAKSSDCDVFGSAMLMKVSHDLAYYPDVSVVCDPVDVEERFTERPCLVVEIASPSTADHDQREKLLGYRRIDALRAYLIVFQDERRVICHWRDDSGRWRKDEVAGAATISLTCPPTTLSLDDIYRRVTFASD
jgi:Uma2 family endonuclease